MSVQVEFQGLHNVRDLGGTGVRGGGTVKRGLLFRSDQLVAATADDIVLLKELGVGAVIDFRSPAECEEKPDPEIEGVRSIAIPIIEDVRPGITRDKKSKLAILKLLARGGDELDRFVTAYMHDMYRAFVGDELAVSQYARFVDEVITCANRGQAALWHCSAGKDRAGFATALVLSALGASWDDVLADYLLTNECMPAVEAQLRASLGKLIPKGGKRSAVRKFFVADADYLQIARAEAENRYGSFECFLKEGLGITAEKQARMRDLFVERE